MQEFFFVWAALNGTCCEPNVLIFETEKEHKLQTDENIIFLFLRRNNKKKKELIHLNSHVYFGVCCLYFLNTSEQK